MTPNLQVLWRFARPHTVYGTSASLLGLYLLAGFVAAEPTALLAALPQLGVAWAACLAANVYIVGLNQLTDIEIDRINKPHFLLTGQGAWMLLGHGLGLGILLGYGVRLDLGCRDAIVAYYQLIWKLFYLEYLLYPWAFFPFS